MSAFGYKVDKFLFKIKKLFKISKLARSLLLYMGIKQIVFKGGRQYEKGN